MTGQFLKLSQKKQFHLMGALRGPDSPARHTPAYQFIKTNVTGRIRCIIWGRYSPRKIQATWEYYRLTQGELEELGRRINEIRAEGLHYVDHLALAVKATRRHRIWGGHADELLRLLGHSQ